MQYHIVAFIVGFFLDLIIGDPYSLPHPVRWIGRLISRLEIYYIGEKGSEKELSQKKKRCYGGITVFIVIFSAMFFSGFFLFFLYHLNVIAGCITEAIMTYQLLATKCLKTESMKVYKELKKKDIEGARKAVSMIVGRDTMCLDECGVTKAAVETVAESTSDGVIAPMFYLAIGGPVLGFFYKAINTCDSMIGYKNDRYMDFGRCAAKLDDIVNFLPARMSGHLMMLACLFLGKDYDIKQAMRIYKRDRYRHASPNSAHTESVMAGALHIMLAGDAYYFGKLVKKQVLGDAIRPVEVEDIRRANKLLYGTAFLGEILCVFVLLLLIG